MGGILRHLGYREAEIITFYGHRYYEKVPVVRNVERAFASIAERRDWSTFSSFVHIVARK
jgi:hypothetical protein